MAVTLGVALRSTDDGPGVPSGEAQRAADRLATSPREDREGDGAGGTGHPG